MFLKEFSSTVMQRNADEVFKAAYKNPILIRRQKRGNKKMDDAVMMSKREYERLVRMAEAAEKAKEAA